MTGVVFPSGNGNLPAFNKEIVVSRHPYRRVPMGAITARLRIPLGEMANPDASLTPRRRRCAMSAEDALYRQFATRRLSGKLKYGDIYALLRNRVASSCSRAHHCTGARASSGLRNEHRRNTS
jgi:hypothetical protein